MEGVYLVIMYGFACVGLVAILGALFVLILIATGNDIRLNISGKGKQE